MKARRCDRCGEYYTPDSETEEIEGVHRLLEMITASPYTQRLDLCAKCSNYLRSLLGTFGERVRGEK